MEPMYRDEELITIPYAALIYDEIEEYRDKARSIAIVFRDFPDGLSHAGSINQSPPLL
jgi:hypothetical protein